MEQHGGRHHLHVRKRMYKNLEAFPHPRLWKRRFDKFMFAIALFGPASALPQVHQTLTTKDVSGMSLFTWGLWVILTVVWLIYGIIHKEKPLIISQGIYLVLNLIVVAAIIIYT